MLEIEDPDEGEGDQEVASEAVVPGDVEDIEALKERAMREVEKKAKREDAHQSHASQRASPDVSADDPTVVEVIEERKERVDVTIGLQITGIQDLSLKTTIL